MLALALAACSPDDPTPPQGEALPVDGQVVAYACEDGREARVLYATDDTAELDLAGETFALNPVPATQGRRWIGQSVEWWLTDEAGQEVATLRTLSPERVGAALLARCVRPSGETGVLPAPSTPTEAAATAPDCLTPALRIATAGSDAGAGQRGTTVSLTNAGSDACTLSGWVRLEGREGQELQVERSGEAGQPLTLAPGQSAYFDLLSSAIPREDAEGPEPCVELSRVRVGAPGDSGLATVTLNQTACGSRVRITPLRAQLNGAG